jgi:hypothetical protein
MSNAILYNPEPGTVHVQDMHRDASLHNQQLSDLAIGMLWFGLVESVIPQTDVCDFYIVFLPHLRFREPRSHYGRPFLGPDDRVVVLRGEPMVGSNDNGLLISPLNHIGILRHPNYQQWISNLIFRGGDRNNSLYHAGIMARTIRPPPSPPAAPGDENNPTNDAPDAPDNGPDDIEMIARLILDKILEFAVQALSTLR